MLCHIVIQQNLLFLKIIGERMGVKKRSVNWHKWQSNEYWQAEETLLYISHPYYPFSFN